MKTTEATWEACETPPFQGMLELAGTIHTGRRDAIGMQILAHDNGHGLTFIYRRWIISVKPDKSLWERLV